MISNKKQKKVLISIIVLLLFIASSFLITKIIYDSIFIRYDCQTAHFEKPLENIINSRKNFKYKCNENLLAGFLYESSSELKNDTLIVLAPGFNACSESYLWQIKELCDYGWSVFAFDATGTGSSEGSTSIGFPQEVIDLEKTLDFIEENNRFNYKNVALMGHSRGGYAVCCALAEKRDIAAVISISGANSAMEGVIGASKKYVGNFAYANYGLLWLYQTMLFGEDVVNLRADEVLKTTQTPVLVIHGKDDGKIPINEFSIMSYKDKIANGNVEYLVCGDAGSSGHNDLLFDSDGTADDILIGKINDFLNMSIK